MAFSASRSTFTGDKELIRKLEALGRGGRADRKKLRSAVKETVREFIFDPSQDLVPVRRGKLKRSAKLSVRVGEKQIMGKVRYGGKLAPYAVIVHERHKTQSKFLERPAVASRRAIGPALAQRIDLAGAVR